MSYSEEKPGYSLVLKNYFLFYKLVVCALVVYTGKIVFILVSKEMIVDHETTVIFHGKL